MGSDVRCEPYGVIVTSQRAMSFPPLYQRATLHDRSLDTKATVQAAMTLYTGQMGQAPRCD